MDDQGEAPGAAVVPGDHHMVGLALGHACGDGAHTNFDTSLTLMSALCGATFFRSWISCARSSIE
jgi:hypothetical protein